MASYLMKYKGKYRLRANIDKSTNNFPREYNDQFSDNDVYIDCQKNIRIHHYGKQILETYIPSIGRGHNIIKAIQSELGKDIIYNIVETDSEILFQFNSKHMEQLEPYLKPKTSGADRSPFSSKNIQKSKYEIPDEELSAYKKIVENIPQNQLIAIVHTTNNYLKSLATKKNTLEDIKSDMTLKGLKNKEYIHSIGKWDEYINYLNEELIND